MDRYEKSKDCIQEELNRMAKGLLDAKELIRYAQDDLDDTVDPVTTQGDLLREIRESIERTLTGCDTIWYELDRVRKETNTSLNGFLQNFKKMTKQHAERILMGRVNGSSTRPGEQEKIGLYLHELMDLLEGALKGSGTQNNHSVEGLQETIDSLRSMIHPEGRSPLATLENELLIRAVNQVEWEFDRRLKLKEEEDAGCFGAEKMAEKKTLPGKRSGMRKNVLRKGRGKGPSDFDGPLGAWNSRVIKDTVESLHEDVRTINSNLEELEEAIKNGDSKYGIQLEDTRDNLEILIEMAGSMEEYLHGQYCELLGWARAVRSEVESFLE